MDEEQRVNAIVTGLYRLFKGWSKRGFGPDDVTWCEVKAEIQKLVALDQVGIEALTDGRDRS